MIVELVANVNLGKDLTILAKGGRVVIIGSRGRVEIDPRDTMQRDADIRGMVLPNTPPEELASIHAALVAGLENGTLRPVIGKEFPLADAARGASSGHGVRSAGKNRARDREVGKRKLGNQEARKETKRRNWPELFRFAPDDVFVVCISAAPAALDRYPRGVTGHVAHPIHSIRRFSV